MHKENDLVAVVNYCKVVKSGTNKIVVQDVDNGTSFEIEGKELLDNLKSASSFEKEEKLTLTKLAELVSTSFNTPITVCFDKQDGNERVLRGRILSSEPLLGRSHAEDLDLPKTDHRLRLVDHRTIKWAVINGKKYVVSTRKKKV